MDRRKAGSQRVRVGVSVTICLFVSIPPASWSFQSAQRRSDFTIEGRAKLLAIVYGVVIRSGAVRREFLLNSFDRDLSFLLTGGSAQWSFWIYGMVQVLASPSASLWRAAVSLRLHGAAALAARTLARGMSWFLSLSSLIGLVVAVIGFNGQCDSICAGPTDVATAVCDLLVYAVKDRAQGAWVGWNSRLLVFLGFGCSAHVAQPSLNLQALGGNTLWLAPVRNSTGADSACPAPIHCSRSGRWREKSRPITGHGDGFNARLAGARIEHRKITVSLRRSMIVVCDHFVTPAARRPTRARPIFTVAAARRHSPLHTDGRSPLRIGSMCAWCGLKTRASAGLNKFRKPP